MIKLAHHHFATPSELVDLGKVVSSQHHKKRHPNIIDAPLLSKYSCKELKLKPNKFIYLVSDKLETQRAEKHIKGYYRILWAKYRLWEILQKTT